jgi:hypothetical protein
MGARRKPRAIQHGIRSIAVGVYMLAVFGAGPAGAVASAQRFHVSATVSPRPSLQSSGRLDLKAVLSPARNAMIGGGYAMSASASASPSVCTSDTIFANGFDP